MPIFFSYISDRRLRSPSAIYDTFWIFVTIVVRSFINPVITCPQGLILTISRGFMMSSFIKYGMIYSKKKPGTHFRALYAEQ